MSSGIRASIETAYAPGTKVAVSFAIAVVNIEQQNEAELVS